MRTVRSLFGVCAAWAALVLPVLALAQVIEVREPLTTATARNEESNLADVVADAIRSAGQAEIALIPATSFADATVPAGQAKPEDFEKALVFRGDTIVVMKLTGAQIRKALEHAFGLYPAKSAAFLQVSGIVVTVNGTAPRGQRVEAIRCGKEALDDAKLYRVAMPAPLASGALVYSKAWSRDDMERDTKVTLGEALREYLGKLTEVSIKAGERIVVRK